jgi:hypothetical protein
MVSFGDGTQIYTLNPDTDSFNLTAPRMTMPGCFLNLPSTRRTIVIGRPIRAYIDGCLAGIDGPRAQNFNLRRTPLSPAFTGARRWSLDPPQKWTALPPVTTCPTPRCPPCSAIAACCGPEVYP